MIYPTLFVGIDISKLKHDIVIVNEQKQVVHKPFVVREQPDDYQRLLATLDRLRQQYGTETFYVGMEATSDYWKNLYHFLKRHAGGCVPTVINPIRTRAFAKTELRRAKTDPVNARDIALFMVEKRPRPSTDRPPLFESIKDLDRQVYHLKKQQTMLLNKLRLELAKVAPEIEQAHKAFGGQQLLTLLQSFPTAEAIAAATVEELHAVRYGQHQWPLPLVFVHKMKALAEKSIAHKTGIGAGYVVQSLVRKILSHQQETQLLKQQMVELYHHVKEQDSLLTTIKGIRKETAIALEAYIGDASRFPDAKKIVAYFGMNPVVNLSGKATKRASYLEKRGSGIVRHKLYMALLQIVRLKQGPIYDYYARLVAAGKPKLVAITAAMRKLLVVIYVMLKHQQPFDPKSK